MIFLWRNTFHPSHDVPLRDFLSPLGHVHRQALLPPKQPIPWGRSEMAVGSSFSHGPEICASDPYEICLGLSAPDTLQITTDRSQLSPQASWLNSESILGCAAWCHVPVSFSQTAVTASISPELLQGTV